MHSTRIESYFQKYWEKTEEEGNNDYCFERCVLWIVKLDIKKLRKRQI